MISNLDKEKYLFYKEIFLDKSEIKIWKKLENGCYIGTLGYSDNNVKILYKLLKSFEEQYGEIITLDSASDELKLYQEKGKLFIYFDENLNPVSMNGVTYNEDNVSVSFNSIHNEKINNIYFYGLSTIPSYRGKGACKNLINFVIEYDLVYARTDLIDSKSEWIMENAGMQICMEDDKIIVEWVDVTDKKGDYRLHLWLPLKSGLYIKSKSDAKYADKNTRKILKDKTLMKTYKF